MINPVESLPCELDQPQLRVHVNQRVPHQRIITFAEGSEEVPVHRLAFTGGREATRSEDEAEGVRVQLHALPLHPAIEPDGLRRSVVPAAGSNEGIPEECGWAGRAGEDPEGVIQIIAAVGIGEAHHEVGQRRRVADGAGDDHVGVKLGGLLRS